MEVLTLGNKIKNRRKELNLTLRELAGSRVTPAQLSYVETDKCKPSLDLLEYIAKELNLEMDYLLESEAKQASKFCEYNVKLADMDITNFNYSEAKDRLTQVIEASRVYGLKFYNGEAERLLGKIYCHLCNYDKSYNHYLNALHEFSRIEDIKKIAEVYMGLGLAACKTGNYQSSLVYFNNCESSISKYKEVDLSFNHRVYYYIMAVSANLKYDAQALLYGEKLSECISLINDKVRYEKTFMDMAVYYENENNYEKAIECINKLSEIKRCTSELEFSGTAETYLGNIYSINNKIDSSIYHLSRSINIKKVTDDESIPLTLIALANSYMLRKDYDSAFKAINDALNISISTCNRKYEEMAYNQLYIIYREKGDFIRAEESIRKRADILETGGGKEELAVCFIEMGRFYKRINREKEAYSYIKKALEISKDNTLINRK